MSGCGGKNFVGRLARSERPYGAREGIAESAAK